MPHKPFKAVIPAAGLGTRFLPATKAMPKEMLPVVDKPAIQYVVEEAAQAGHRRHPRSSSGATRTQPRQPLRLGARARGQARRTRATTTSSRAVVAVERPRRHPLRASGRAEGSRTRRAARPRARRRHAVRGAARRRPHRRARPAADDDDRRARAHRRDGHRAHGGRPRPHPPVRRGRGRGDRRPTDVVRVTGLVEKPTPEDAPSNLADHRPLRADAPRSSTSSSAPSRARAARSSSPTRCRSSPPTPTAPACTASSSAAVATTPAIGWTTSRPSCSSPPIARTSDPSCVPGSRSSRRRSDAARARGSRGSDDSSSAWPGVDPPRAPARRAGAAAGAAVQPRLAAAVGGDEPRRPGVVRHAARRPAPAAAVPRRRRRSVRHGVRR